MLLTYLLILNLLSGHSFANNENTYNNLAHNDILSIRELVRQEQIQQKEKELKLKYTESHESESKEQHQSHTIINVDNLSQIRKDYFNNRRLEGIYDTLIKFNYIIVTKWSPYMGIYSTVQKYRHAFIAFVIGTIFGFLLSCGLLYQIFSKPKLKSISIQTDNYCVETKEASESVGENEIKSEKSSEEDGSIICVRSSDPYDAVSKISLSENKNTEEEELTSCSESNEQLINSSNGLKRKTTQNKLKSNKTEESNIMENERINQLKEAVISLESTLQIALKVLIESLNAEGGIQDKLSTIARANVWFANREAKKDLWIQMTDSISIGCIIMHMSMYICSIMFGRLKESMECQIPHFNVFNIHVMSNFVLCVMSNVGR